MESKIMLADVLANVKSMVVNYALALNEASSEFIYNEYLNEFENLSLLAKKLYNFSYSLGWATLDNAESKKIKKAINKQKDIITGKTK
ncbi:MAG: spore coat protein [bacterium]|nr:spore coat protein [bacterium]